MNAIITRDTVAISRSAMTLVVDIVRPQNMAFWADYGIINLRGNLHVVSKKNGSWQTLIPNSAYGFCLSHRGETYYYSRDRLFSIYEAGMNSIKATSVPATSHAAPKVAVSSGTLMADAIIYNTEKEMTQFVRKGTSYNDINALVVRRGFPQTEKTLIMFLGSQTVRRL